MRKQPTMMDLKNNKIALAAALGISEKRDSELSFMVSELMTKHTKKAECLAELAERTDIDEYESVYCAFRLYEQILIKRSPPALRAFLREALEAV